MKTLTPLESELLEVLEIVNSGDFFLGADDDVVIKFKSQDPLVLKFLIESAIKKAKGE